MVGDGFAVLHEQHPVRQPADLHLLPDKAEWHRISAPLEADEAVDANRTAHDDVERLDQRVGQWRQILALARPGLRDTGSGRRAAQLQRARLEPPVGFRLKLLKAPGGQLVGIDNLPKILYRPLDLALRLRMTGLAGIDVELQIPRKGLVRLVDLAPRPSAGGDRRLHVVDPQDRRNPTQTLKRRKMGRLP